MLNQRYKFRKNLIILILTDIILFVVAYAGSYLLRFDMKVPYIYYLNFRNTLVPIIILKTFIFFWFGLYRGMWRYTSLKDLENIIKASLVSSASIIVFILAIHRFEKFSRSVFFVDGILTIFLTGGLRLGIRLFFDYRKRGSFTWNKDKKLQKKGKKVLIIGAGDAGEKILREIHDNVDLHYHVIGFLDDDYNKINRLIHGVKVIDSIDGIISLQERTDFDEIIIALPSVSGERMRQIIDLCNNTGVPYKTVPGMGELINGKVTITRIRNVSYIDLLGRNPVELEMDKIGAYLKEKTVLITGAGGSIGSEFCRQVARFDPEVLIMFDRTENSLYEIETEMRDLFPGQTIVPILGSVTCLDRLKRVFSELEPQVVFHAAAYKHVPMLEIHPWEAVYNNILGTKYTLDVAREFGAERFILVSTDKAVRPTNIMGATKRVAEIILQLRSRDGAAMESLSGGNQSKTKMMAVRFGNVVGSSGSVIPLFKKQIARGGPVTVTHPDVIRYFMTVSEAVQLILQAGCMGEDGDIYILKMGKPVKIIDMARDLIRLSGFEPEKDIRLEISGLRPGEKLYEELITEGEGIIPTVHSKIMVLRSTGYFSNGLEYPLLEKKLQELFALSDEHDADSIKLKLREIVPEYIPQFLIHKKDEKNPKVYSWLKREREIDLTFPSC
ncbi:MAG: polysaccharide biosynthesis protein [bacterium]